MRNIILKIAICDDEEFYREHIKELAIDHLKKHGFAFEITLFQNGEEFCENNRNLLFYDIIFLDIKMGTINGMDVAHKIREVNQKASIIFITVAADYVYEGYEVDASRYILKKDFDRLLPRCMDSLIEKKFFHKKKQRFHFTSGDEDVFIRENKGGTS